MKAKIILFMLMIISIIIVSGCSDDLTKPVMTIPTVTSVEVSPANAVIVLPGEQQQFTATVIGDNDPPQTVIWAVIAIPNTGGISSGTTITTQGGLLTVASDETAPFFTVTATSVLDPTQTGVVAVSTTNILPPEVYSVEVYPEGAELAPGEQLQFEAYVQGEAGVLQNVRWSVTGGITGTGITQNGLLTVSNNEPAFTFLTVKAAYLLNSSKYGEATVMIMPGSLESVINRVALANVIRDEDWQHLAGVEVELVRPIPIIDVNIRINNTACENRENWSGQDEEDGLYYYYGVFAYTPSLFIDGTAYSVAVTVDGVPFTGSVTMAHTPVVTAPDTFVPTQPMTFNWTMGGTPMIQELYIEYYTMNGQWDYLTSGPINPSLTTFTIPADTVPSNWVFLDFHLDVLNVSISNMTVFVAARGNGKNYSNDAVGAERSGNIDRDRGKKTRSMIKEYLKL